MARITDEVLKIRLERLNEVFGYKRKYVKSKAEYIGKEFGLDWAYGNVQLVQYTGKGYAESDVSPRGTKSEIYDYINAMIKGIALYKERNKK